MVMKESLVSRVDSTETLAPKTARGERLAAAKTAKTGFSQAVLASGAWLFCMKRLRIECKLALADGHPSPRQRGGDCDQRQRKRMKDRRGHPVRSQHRHVEHRQGRRHG